jgi:hypothetical protein
MKTLLASLTFIAGSALAQTPPLPTPPLPPPQAVMGESAEQAFARGYQRGWADAAERLQQRPRGGNKPRACMKVTVLDATYYADRNGCDATRAVSEIAGGRSSAAVPASNQLCGDPFPGRGKALAVEYACGEPAFCGNEVRTATTRESGTLQLNCTQ